MKTKLNKILIAALLLFVVCAGANVFADGLVPPFKLKIGGGGYFTGNVGDGFEWKGGPTSTSPDLSYKNSYWGGGGYLFFDATYGEVFGGFFYGKYTADGAMVANTTTSVMGVDVGVYGKYPFPLLGGKLLVFPLVGATWRFGFDDDTGVGALWIKGGVGVDYVITKGFFVRGEVLYGVRLPTKSDKDFKEILENANASDIKQKLGHGPEIKVAVGWQFL
jgi:hypothetical protein